MGGGDDKERGGTRSGGEGGMRREQRLPTLRNHSASRILLPVASPLPLLLTPSSEPRLSGSVLFYPLLTLLRRKKKTPNNRFTHLQRKVVMLVRSLQGVPKNLRTLHNSDAIRGLVFRAVFPEHGVGKCVQRGRFRIRRLLPFHDARDAVSLPMARLSRRTFVALVGLPR